MTATVSLSVFTAGYSQWLGQGYTCHLNGLSFDLVFLKCNVNVL